MDWLKVKRILELINQDDELKKIYELITSINGVGQILDTELIVYTHLFSRLNNANQAQTLIDVQILV